MITSVHQWVFRIQATAMVELLGNKKDLGLALCNPAVKGIIDRLQVQGHWDLDSNAKVSSGYIVKLFTQPTK